MDTARPRRKPWKSWRDFAAWAQDFSLRAKVLGGFLGVVVVVGLATMLVGTRLARETILERARVSLTGDLATARFVLTNFTEALERNVRLTASLEGVRKMLEKGDMDGVRNRLALLCVENDMDFLSITDEKGRVLVRGFDPESKGNDVSSDPIIKEAIEGRGASGVSLIPVGRLARENPTFMQHFTEAKIPDGLVLQAASPVVVENKVAMVVYGGVILNHDNRVVERISQLVFKGVSYRGTAAGYVTIFEGDEAIAGTLRTNDRLPVLGIKAEDEMKDAMLDKGQSITFRGERFGHAYLSAAEPIRDFNGRIVGAMVLAGLEDPINSVIDRLVGTFLVVALLGVLLMAAISYFLVQWINRPLEMMLHSVRRAAEGDLSHEVPVMSRDELGELAAGFNLMIRNLAESYGKLEEWGKELASKVAAQTGELDQALEQVARVKKLASLEKMADGMARIMAHISDPLGPTYLEGDDDGVANNKILVLDHEERVLDICQRILESEGFEVTLSRTVEEALKSMEEEIYDVVVADIDMPGVSGAPLLKEIKYRQPDSLVIFTAPFKSHEVAAEAVKLGAFDYIPKPFGPHQILLMVYTALQARQTLDKTRREHASQRAEKIFQRLPVAIALADGAHRVVYNNKAFVELTCQEGQGEVTGRTFKELFGVDPLERVAGQEESPGGRWLELGKLGRTAKLYNFKLPEEDLRVLMLVDVTDTVKKDQQADVLRTETLTRAQQVIHQQMRVAQEIAGLLGETTAETKAALFELINLAKQTGEAR